MKDKLLKIMIKYPIVEIIGSFLWLYPFQYAFYNKWILNITNFFSEFIIIHIASDDALNNYGRGIGITIGFASFLAFCIIKIVILILAIYYFRKYKSSLYNKKTL